MNAPHRKTPPTAQLTLEIDGVPYTAQVTLTVGQPVQAKRSAALTVVQPASELEATLCPHCAQASVFDTSCVARGLVYRAARDFECTYYSPSSLTRLLRAFRLGRAPVYLASPEPAEQGSSERRTLRANPLD